MKIEGTVSEVPAVAGRGWEPSEAAKHLFTSASVLADGQFLHVICDSPKELNSLHGWMKKQGFKVFARAKVNLYVSR